MIGKFAVASAALAVAAPATAQIAVDGTREAAYGAAKSHVTYDPNADTGNFGQEDHPPTALSNASSYDIYLTSDANYVYGFIQNDRVLGDPSGANLYFDLNRAQSAGSDIGFEITNDRAFVPGEDGYAENLAGISFAYSADGRGLEFSLANSLFTGPIAGLNYAGNNNPFGGPFPKLGDTVTLRLSQSFGYSVAGGPSYGDDRLGTVALGGVPEPATWALMIMGFGAVGGALRRRASVRTAVRFA